MKPLGSPVVTEMILVKVPSFLLWIMQFQNKFYFIDWVNGLLNEWTQERINEWHILEVKSLIKYVIEWWVD
jgi:hypothetical protein